MAKTNGKYDKVLGFPSPYVPNSEKNSDEYAKKIFKAVLDSTAQYRENRLKQTTRSRAYAKGEQSLQQYLDELNISGNKQYVNIQYSPSKILQKFEKIVVDDYQQLEEKPKAIAKAYHIQERKERKKADLKFRMEFKEQIAQLEEQLGFPVEDQSIKVPEDEDELNLIASLNSEEREELLMNKMIEKVLEDNDIESLKRMFLSDIFQVNFSGFHHYTDNKGNIKVRLVSTEDALYDGSMFEDFREVTFSGSHSTMNIGEIRRMFNVSSEKEIELWKLARRYRGRYENHAVLDGGFNYDWRYTVDRPYDNFTVDVYHLWYRTVKNVGYVEGKDSYGKDIFDIDNDISSIEIKSNNRKQTGVTYPETAYEGWFAGNSESPIVLEWGEQMNQVRRGNKREYVENPYIFFMPENRGTMKDMSAVERVISEIEMMDSQMLQIKITLANHPPSGYAIDHEALMDVDLGTGEDLQPLDLEDIYQQTGRLYYKKRKDDGTQDNSSPIIPISINISDKINTHLTIYNLALNNIRDILGVNPSREGTADLSRVSTANAQTSLSVSQTATYYIYRAYLKATEKLIKQIGIRIIDVLTYGTPDRGYLKYLGQENIDFVKEREDIIDAGTYTFKINPQMTREDKQRLEGYINSGIASGDLSIPDALLIESLKDIDLAEKYLRYLYNKNKKETQQQAIEMQDRQIQGQGDMAIRVEEAKRETFSIQSALQANEWKIKGENSTEVAILDMAQQIMKARLEAISQGMDINIPQEYAELERLVLDNAIIKQEKSSAETEKQMEEELNNEQAQEEEVYIQQLQQAVESGEITQQEAEAQIEQMGTQ